MSGNIKPLQFFDVVSLSSVVVMEVEQCLFIFIALIDSYYVGILNMHPV